jgi:CRP-like cAMP-binding protein
MGKSLWANRGGSVAVHIGLMIVVLLGMAALGSGSRQILSFYLPGDFIGFESLAGEGASTNVRTMTEAVLCEFDPEQLFSLLVRTKESMLGILSAQAKSQMVYDKTIIALSKYSAIGRMLHLILYLRSRLAERGEDVEKRFPLPLRRDDFSDALGLTPVHVSRTLTTLRRNNIVEFRRGILTILDNERLLGMQRKLCLTPVPSHPKTVPSTAQF